MEPESDGDGGVHFGHDLVEGMELTGWSHRSTSVSEGPSAQSLWEGERRRSVLAGLACVSWAEAHGRELEELGLGLPCWADARRKRSRPSGGEEKGGPRKLGWRGRSKPSGPKAGEEK